MLKSTNMVIRAEKHYHPGDRLDGKNPGYQECKFLFSSSLLSSSSPTPPIYQDLLQLLKQLRHGLCISKDLA